MANDYFGVSNSAISHKIKELNETTDLVLVASRTLFQAHKAVLASFSDFLLTAFQTPGGTFTYILEDVLPEDVEYLLMYVYEAKLVVPENRIPGLIRAAKQLKITSILNKLGAFESDSIGKQQHNPITEEQPKAMDVDTETAEIERSAVNKVQPDHPAQEDAPIPSESIASSSGNIFVFQPVKVQQRQNTGVKPQPQKANVNSSAKVSTPFPKKISLATSAMYTAFKRRGAQKVRQQTPMPQPPTPYIRKKTNAELVKSQAQAIHPGTPRPGTTPDREQRQQCLAKKNVKVYRRIGVPIVCSTMLTSMLHPPVPPNPLEEMKNNENVIPTPEPQKKKASVETSGSQLESTDPLPASSYSSSDEWSSDPAVLNKKISPGTFIVPPPPPRKKAEVVAKTNFRVGDLVEKKESKFRKPALGNAKATGKCAPARNPKVKPQEPDQRQQNLELLASGAFQNDKVLKLGETDFLQPSQPGGNTADDSDSFASGNPWAGRKKLPVGNRRRIPASNRIINDSTVSFFDPNAKRRYPGKKH